MSFPYTMSRRKRAMLQQIRERLKGFEIRQLIREEIRRRKHGKIPLVLDSNRQIRMFAE